MSMPPRVSRMLLELLDLAEDTVFFLSKPGMERMNRYWGYTETRAAYRAFDLWQEQQYVEAVRKGEKALYRIGRKGKELLAKHRPSATSRHRKWDERWRMVVFDFPESARKARDAFRWTLRQQRLGCLQKSVWISPDPILAEWKRMLKEAELKEWVLLFESSELGPVDDSEIARKVWRLDELQQKYERHISTHASLVRQLQGARASRLEGDLGDAVRRESQDYFDILHHDPLLPIALCPPNFAGVNADSLHGEIRALLRSILLAEKP